MNKFVVLIILSMLFFVYGCSQKRVITPISFDQSKITILGNGIKAIEELKENDEITEIEYDERKWQLYQQTK